MRRLTWGKNNSEFVDYTMRPIRGGSQLVYGSGINAVDVVDDATSGQIKVFGTNGQSSTLTKISLTTLRSLIGHAPVLLRGDLKLWRHNTTSSDVAIGWAAYRLVTVVDYTDATQRYKDATGPVVWGNTGDDPYAPVPGIDVPAVSFATGTAASVVSGENAAYDVTVDVRSELQLALLAASDLRFWMVQNPLSGSTLKFFLWHWDVIGKRPYLDLAYVLPIELFSAKIDGTINSAGILDAAQGSDDYRLFLGAVMRSETGTPVKAFVKNFSGRTFPHLEVWDDAPEWADPVQTAGTGTGTLPHVNLASDAVSQHYYIRFTSGTAYEIKALAFRDNPVNLNSSYGGAGWTGAIGADWVAPSGGLTIPTAAWGGTPAVNDVWEVSVLGNSTDPAWPADSGDQVQITSDSGGNPVTAGWRGIRGARTRSTSSTTIDATTKTIAVRNISTAAWVIGAPAFIADTTNINEGIIDSVTAATVVISGLTANSNVYAANSYVGTTLPLRALAPAIYTQTTAAAGVSQTVKNRLTVAAVTGFVAAQGVHVEDIADSTIWEDMVVASVGASTIDLTANLTKDYAIGAMVTVIGTGEVAVWLRCVASASTVEQRKDIRLNVRA